HGARRAGRRPRRLGGRIAPPRERRRLRGKTSRGRAPLGRGKFRRPQERRPPARRVRARPGRAPRAATDQPHPRPGRPRARMIFFDVTKTGAAGHRSGLTRVSARLREELGERATAVRWPEWKHNATASDWFFTAELFSEDERPGFTEFLAQRHCRAAAVFHDAIPLQHPHITWPQSVARHPAYLKLLARFDRVFAVSAASRDELLGFWRWQGIER